MGGAATEGTLRAQVANYGWLHVATHARVAEESTAQSYLLLARGAGGAGDDGILTAEEVQRTAVGRDDGRAERMRHGPGARHG